MNNICQIKDDDEILEEEKNRYNFGRFTPEEIQKKHSPFERVSKKKEIPFLFQKKRFSPKLEGKMSLEDIMDKIEKLDLSGNTFSPKTPPYPPHTRPPTPMPSLELGPSILNEIVGLKESHKIEVDESQ